MTVYIIIVNYNGWADTLECLESVFRNDYPDYRVVVVDNASSDTSIGYIKAWAEQRLDSWLPKNYPLRRLSFPPRSAAIPYYHLQLNQMEQGISVPDARLSLIESSENLGFSGGNNAGIRFALQQNADFVWLLNNDTVIEQDALSQLIQHYKKEGEPGIIGSKLMEYHVPEKVQALGGKINKYFGQTRHIITEAGLKNLNYIIGASFLIPRKCLKTSGLLDEDLFLYCEDCEYCLRAAQYGFSVSMTLSSIVYHKEGNSSTNLYKDYYGLRNTLYVNQKYFRRYWFSTNAYFFGLRFMKHLIRFHREDIGIAIKAVADFWKGRMGKQL